MMVWCLFTHLKEELWILVDGGRSVISFESPDAIQSDRFADGFLLFHRQKEALSADFHGPTNVSGARKRLGVHSLDEERHHLLDKNLLNRKSEIF